MWKRLREAWDQVIGSLHDLAAANRQAAAKVREAFGLDDEPAAADEPRRLPAAGENGHARPAAAGRRR